MAPAEGADDKAEPNVAAQALQSSDGSDGGASDEKEDEEETKFVEWDPSGRFGRVRSLPPPCFSRTAVRFRRLGCAADSAAPRCRSRARPRARSPRARARHASLCPPARGAIPPAALFSRPFSARALTPSPLLFFSPQTTKLLGRGTYKNVYMAFDEENGMDVAWNQVKVNGLPREEKQRLLSEVEILKELDHKNIIKLYH